MKKITLLIVIAMSLSINATAKKTPIVGKWLLTKVEMKGEVQDVYQEVEFKSDGYMSMMGRVLGKWTLDRKANTLTIETDMIKEFAGTRKIKKHSKTGLILVGENDKIHFISVNPDAIAKENKKSGLAGTWVANAEEDGKKYITLELPDTYKAITKTEYSTSKSSGNWMYNSKDKSIVILSMDRQLRGKNTIVSEKDNELTLNNKGNDITLVKQDESAVKKATDIERLTFTEEEFYDDNGNPKYEADAEKLPWKDPYAMYESLKKIKSLEYEMSSLVEETNVFEVKELSSKMDVDKDMEVAKFDNIFVGYDRNTLPEDTEMPTLTIESNVDTYIFVPFPYESYTFRVTSNNEQITVKAGTYSCTVVELFGDREERIKLWMINDKPCIVAKIIIEEEGSFGPLKYTMYELMKINQQ